MISPLARQTEGSDWVVGVVIPFFQRRSGLLLAAIRSVLAQDMKPACIIVVDDGSPLAASDELGGLAPHERNRVSLIRQKNAGPGAARNRGLAALPDAINVVAFLDSDDAWVAGHLSNAVAAFDAGADFYFADYVPLGSSVSTFELCGLTQETGVPLHTGTALRRYSGTLFDALLIRSPVGTSTVVYRRTIGQTIRFRTDFSYGEDVFFWMELAEHASMIAFSTRHEATYGAGVNIAAGAVWGTPQHLRRSYDDFAFHRAIATRFRLTAEQTRWNRAWMDELAQSFAMSLMHLLRRRSTIDWSIVRRFIRVRPTLPIHFVTQPIAVLTARLRRS